MNFHVSFIFHFLFIFRRSLEVTLKFCQSNGLGSNLSSQVTNYFNFLNADLDNSCELDDFQLLSSSLQLEFVLKFSQESLASVMPLYFPMTFNENVRQYIYCGDI